MWTISEVARKAGVSKQTVRRWHREGRIQGLAYNDHGQYLYDVEKGIPMKRRRDQILEIDTNEHVGGKEVQYEG